MMPIIPILPAGPVGRGKHICYNTGMKVKVKLFASLRSLGPDEQILDLPASATIDDVVHILKIPETIRLLKIVNGEHRPADHVLQDGDDLALFPPIAGG
jgi:molybdopterin converting factor small subunit